MVAVIVPFEGKCKHMAAVMISAMHQIQAKS